LFIVSFSDPKSNHFVAIFPRTGSEPNQIVLFDAANGERKDTWIPRDTIRKATLVNVLFVTPKEKYVLLEMTWICFTSSSRLLFFFFFTFSLSDWMAIE
jgi:hypothetical protein